MSGSDNVGEGMEGEGESYEYSEDVLLPDSDKAGVSQSRNGTSGSG